MKKLKLVSLLLLMSASFMLIQCTNDPIPGPAGTNGVDGIDGSDGSDGSDGVSTGAATSTTDLVAQKVFLGPVIDGVIDASWADSSLLTGTATVPNPVATDGTVIFNGYAGNTRDFQIRAQYDAENVYFLAQWKDAEQDGSRDTWYFDATTSRWAQESNKPVFDTDGTTILRDAFYEDKFAMQWPIGTVTSWDTASCYATCHIGSQDVDGGGHHYTVTGEQTDMWHWKSVRTGLPTGQFDDKHITDLTTAAVAAGGTGKARAGDAKDGGGHSNNKISLPLLDGSNAGTNVNVPKYYIPGKTDYYWILTSEVTDGTAVEIVGVHDNGTLDLANGGTIDPVADVDYQRPVTTDLHSPALKGMPSITTAPFVGSRGDLLCGQTYTGNGWILEWKRPLNTGNADDIAYDTTQSYQFGLGIFDNAAIAHAIKPDLTFSFEQ
ncbi:MAG: ethylbenzene dehydrogenase-related protein [Lutibacter sp.]|uniref:ethylbenzene dehydrogenase-related protein n=1 Tax=Lutibacter sp. TaxID=1925666 RepID=UPI00385D02FA